MLLLLFLGCFFFLITVMCDCHLCSVELVFAFVLVTDIFKAVERQRGRSMGKAGPTHPCPALMPVWTAQPVQAVGCEQGLRCAAS